MPITAGGCYTGDEMAPIWRSVTTGADVLANCATEDQRTIGLAVWVRLLLDKRHDQSRWCDHLFQRGGGGGGLLGGSQRITDSAESI